MRVTKVTGLKEALGKKKLKKLKETAAREGYGSEYDFSRIKDQAAVPAYLRGRKLPVIESRTDMSVEVNSWHRKRAIIFDPHRCEIALAVQSSRQAIDYVYIGTGESAYIHFKDDDVVIHFTIRGRAAWVRDNFDTKGEKLKGGVMVTLYRSSPSYRLDKVRERHVRRKRERENGAQPRPPRLLVKTRENLLGVKHRVRAPVVSI